jgi:hypothetical protein
MEEKRLMTKLEMIYGKYKSLKDESKADCQFNKETMEDAFNNAVTISKWITYKSEWVRIHRGYEEERKKIYRKLYEYYQTEYHLKLNTKEEYTLFIESDPQYTEMMNQSQVTKEVILFIDSIIDTLKTKGYEIKNYIEWKKFINGR